MPRPPAASDVPPELGRRPAALLLVALLGLVLAVNVAYLDRFPYPPHSSHDGFLVIPQVTRVLAGLTPEDPAFGMFAPTVFHGPARPLPWADPVALVDEVRNGRLRQVVANRSVQDWIEWPHGLAVAGLLGFLFPGHRLLQALVPTAYLLVLLASLHGLGTALAGRRAGLLALGLAVGMPGLFGFSRYQEVHLPVVALLTLLVLLLVRSDGLRRPLPLLLAGPVVFSAIRTGESGADAWAVALGLSGPLLWSLGVLVGRVTHLRLRWPSARAWWSITAVLLCLGGGAWVLAPHLRWMGNGWRHVADAFMDPAVQYDVVERLGPTWGPVAWGLAYPIFVACDYLAPGLTAFLLLALVFLVREPLRRAALPLLWAGVPFVAFTVLQRKASWYAVQVVPPLALATALGLLALPWRRVRVAAVTLAVGVALTQFLAFTFLPASAFEGVAAFLRQPLPVGEWRLRRVDLLRPVDDSEMASVAADVDRFLAWLQREAPPAGRGAPVWVAVLTMAGEHDFPVRYLLETGRPDLAVVNLGDPRLRARGYPGLVPDQFDWFLFIPGPFRAWPPTEEERAWLRVNLLCQPGDPLDPFLDAVLARAGAPAGGYQLGFGEVPTHYRLAPPATRPAPGSTRGRTWEGLFEASLHGFVPDRADSGICGE